jgi:hypothetical protein
MLMASLRLAMALGTAVLAAACATGDRFDASRGGIALRIADDVDALDDAVERAQDHCEEHDRHAVLQAVSQVGRGELLATFNCVRTRGGGIALVVDDENDLDDAQARARRYCADYDRDAVLQSVSEIEGRGVAAFNCVAA